MLSHLKNAIFNNLLFFALSEILQDIHIILLVVGRLASQVVNFRHPGSKIDLVVASQRPMDCWLIWLTIWRGLEKSSISFPPLFSLPRNLETHCVVFFSSHLSDRPPSFQPDILNPSKWFLCFCFVSYLFGAPLNCRKVGLKELLLEPCLFIRRVKSQE